MITSLLYLAPFFLIYLVGLVLAILHWQRLPRVSLLSAIAFAIFLGTLVLDAGKLYWMMNLAQPGSRQFSLIVGLLSMVRVAADCVGWGLILAAIFSGRGVDREHQSR